MSNRRSAAEGERLLAAFESSGLSRTQFCKQAGITVTTLDYWRWKRARRRGLVQVRVESRAETQSVSAGAAHFRIVLTNGRRIETGAPLDCQALLELIRVAETA